MVRQARERLTRWEREAQWVCPLRRLVSCRASSTLSSKRSKTGADSPNSASSTSRFNSWSCTETTFETCWPSIQLQILTKRLGKLLKSTSKLQSKKMDQSALQDLSLRMSIQNLSVCSCSIGVSLQEWRAQLWWTRHPRDRTPSLLWQSSRKSWFSSLLTNLGRSRSLLRKTLAPNSTSSTWLALKESRKLEPREPLLKREFRLTRDCWHWEMSSLPSLMKRRSPQASSSSRIATRS